MIERRNELFIAWPPFHEQGRGVYFHFNRFFGSCQHAKIKFWVQPFSKGWQFPKAAPLVALRRGRNPTRCASGATQKERKAARRPPAVPAAAISQKLRHDAPLFHPKRKTAPASRSVSTFPSLARVLFGGGRGRTASCGEPLDRVPLGQTAHRAVGPSLPDLLVSSGVFRPLRRAT